MDYEEDFILLDMILKKVGPHASLDKIVEFIDHRPSIMNINHIPKISVYTCAYNAEKYVSQTISSILWSNRQFSDLEYIFVDDGSTDGTLLELPVHMTMDRRIKIIVNEKNEGLASSSNKALSAAHGNYVIRVDADDWMIPGAIDRLIDTAKETGEETQDPNQWSARVPS